MPGMTGHWPRAAVHFESFVDAEQTRTVADRAFCLYVVFGSYARRVRTVPVVNAILATLEIT